MELGCVFSLHHSANVTYDNRHVKCHRLFSFVQDFLPYSISLSFIKFQLFICAQILRDKCTFPQVWKGIYWVVVSCQLCHAPNNVSLGILASGLAILWRQSVSLFRPCKLDLSRTLLHRPYLGLKMVLRHIVLGMGCHRKKLWLCFATSWHVLAGS